MPACFAEPCDEERHNPIQGPLQTAAAGLRHRLRRGYKRHAFKEEPQDIITSDKTNHLAIHKGSALKKVRKGSR